MITYSTPYASLEDTATEQDRATLAQAYQAIQQQKQENRLGFVQLLEDQAGLAAVQQLANQWQGKLKAVVVIGIGGSDLGARAAVQALLPTYFNLDSKLRQGRPQLFFVGDTTDPEPLLEVVEQLDWQQTLLVMISKSGNTIEQMSTFSYLYNQMLEAVGKEAAAKQVVAITDAKSGTMRELVHQEGFASLIIPEAAGGRFSVLSAVGLFPLALVGIEVEQILAGARALEAEDNQAVSLAAKFAWHQWLAYLNHQQTISVLFIYQANLASFGGWFRQLWAESLGKTVNRAGQTVHFGPTPVIAMGPTDQHSQVQLYMEGPDNKLFTFLRVKSGQKDLTLPNPFPENEGVSYLANLSMQQILQAEQEATAAALTQAGRPTALLEIDQLNANQLGQLFYFFELATAYAGELFNLDVYNQPGVELGKKLMFQKLGRKGY